MSTGCERVGVEEVDMRRGRPSKGLCHIDDLDGPQEAKLRLRAILSAVFGRCSVIEACRRMGVSSARFHQLRRQALAGALVALTPGQPGRPAREALVEPGQVEALEQRVQDLRMALEAAQVKTELALAVPEVLLVADLADVKKNRRLKAKTRRQRRRSERLEG